MRKKTKKVYEAPSMRIYEMVRTQILAGSAQTNGYDEDPEFNNW